MLRTLAGAVRRREIAARELVARALERIERHDPGIGAVVFLRADEALEEAARMDEAIARGEDPGPLAGLPLLVKDIEDLAGAPTTFGSLLFADAPPAADDGLVPGRLRRAGAIPVGKTNVPEFAIEGFTANRLFGATRNPWAPALSPGGSSGGSAAALAAGLAAIATASDGGGSIRIPAACCGLVGIKPTNGLVGRRPIPAWIDLSTDGPFATTVEDLRLLLDVEIGPVAGDPAALPTRPPWPGGEPGRVLAAPRVVDHGPVAPEVATAFEAALGALEQILGLEITPIEPAAIFRAGNPDDDWFTIAATEHLEQLGRAVVEANLERLHPSSRAFFEIGLATPLERYLAARRRRFDYVRELDELLGDDGILATPTLAWAGWPAEGPADAPGMPAEVFNTAVQNLTGHPAVSLPAGVLPTGLPFGLQLTGPRFRDDLVLDAAERWERARPWTPAAPGYEPFDA
jgi:Asp-tRNA(Asn)/Glu-tRNA(Gln) amidotransferase A subunit family amidase